MDITASVKREVSKVSPNNDVTLFGSRARGDHRSNSDWDFLIILKQKQISKAEKERIRDNLYELELEIDQVISTIIHSQEEWEKRAVTPIYQIIEEEGIRA